MVINFTMEDSTIENSSIIRNVNGQMEDAQITLRGVKISNSQLFTDLNISGFCADIEQGHRKMSDEEYSSMQRVIKKRADRKAFVNALYQHLISFSEGVAASIVASYIRL